MTDIFDERVRRLHRLAEKRCEEGREELADRYVDIAESISQRTQNSLPKKFKQSYCSNCKVFWCEDRVKIRVEDEARNFTCKECGETTKLRI